ncbi:hypothetical protein [Massilia scottii]|uniref:hypothetical protein n=1 Tax=Massilia scottii TaxID=3057166 RepID=UPI00279690EE|nr:hypothetical protein [Massilia sp. CCM 9029]MDQ1835230.1 hypothetical protein [Massilia sp. CCM 9029]
MPAITSKTIYDNLKAFGLTRAQVRKLLPEWWSAEAEQFPDGLAELCMLISRRLSLDATALLKGEVRRKGNAVSLAYKHSASATVQSLQGATSIALAVADAVAAAMHGTPVVLPTSPKALAKQARSEGAGIVSMESLIKTCWKNGIPIVPIPNLPVGIKKMDGAVIKVGDRPVILISKKKSSRAWLAFILAHELGHIGCGHLDDVGSIIDVSLQEQTTFETGVPADGHEREADEYALEIFGGAVIDERVSSWSKWMSPVELAVKARTAQGELKVESGHLVLRYAFTTKRWPEAMTALNFLSEDAHPEAVMQQYIAANLALDRIADDLRDMVLQVTGINTHASH